MWSLLVDFPMVKTGEAGRPAAIVAFGVWVGKGTVDNNVADLMSAWEVN